MYGQGLIGREDAQGNYLSYHTDMRGSTTMLSDWSGRVTDRYSYGVYGELEQHDGTTSQPFCYNGRDGVMTDPNGLYYMRARYYHPGLKRFLNRDILPGDVTEGQTFNRFAYVNGDPVGFIDPLGLAGLGTNDCPKGKDKGTGGNGIKMLGEKAPQISSKTMWQRGKTERVDIENQAPGKNPGNIHYHEPKNTKWYYNPEDKKFYADHQFEQVASPKIQKMLNDPLVKKAIDKGLKFLGY
ncbi:RHS repeat-associated core domain-containing protein [Brevibacillus laterosporus]|uniref:RHS repeat domain-containing protein n=1 Tax=Brevibacillus laterosporus TaxID=1465 RepID=UPI0030B9E1C0